ncbi:transposase [Siccirubricoccus deserti]|uniref:Transposase n=1 Tax=Siccirubricoccus deserti TaxID=2013562 RepID=A0A9X0R563_9PROT|nr:transposase [Siccirubricoccus deserti]
MVERALGWLGRQRRLSKDYETLPKVSQAMVTLAMTRLMLHRLVHPNRRRLPASCLRKRALRRQRVETVRHGSLGLWARPSSTSCP